MEQDEKFENQLNLALDLSEEEREDVYKRQDPWCESALEAEIQYE